MFSSLRYYKDRTTRENIHLVTSSLFQIVRSSVILLLPLSTCWILNRYHALRKIPVEKRTIFRAERRGKFSLKTGLFLQIHLPNIVYLKKVKSFTSEHFRVSNLINHVTLRIKVKKKYSEWIWRFDAREGKKVKSSCKYPGSGKNERN